MTTLANILLALVIEALIVIFLAVVVFVVGAISALKAADKASKNEWGKD
jgi:hypothetical protein